MAKIRDLTEVTDAMLERAAKWYLENDVPPAFRKLDPRVLRTAKKLADGDWHRCTINDKQPDSITVHNHPVWGPRRRRVYNH